VEHITAYTSDLLLALHRGKLDLAIVDLPIRSRGIGLFPIQSEPLIAVLPQNHPLAQRPMIRLFELKKEQITILSRQIDPGSVNVEAMLLKAGVGVSSVVPASANNTLRNRASSNINMSRPICWRRAIPPYQTIRSPMLSTCLTRVISSIPPRSRWLH